MSGGLKVIYRFVELLNEGGIDACVWHGTDGVSYSSFTSTAPVVTGLERTLAAGDVIVMVEVGGPKWSFLVGDNPCVMLCQGTDFVFQNVELGQDVPGPYPGWRTAAAVLGTSQTIVDFLREACADDFPVHHVPVVVDADRFVPRPKRRQIAYMPRRRRADVLTAALLASRRPELAGWDWVPIDGMTVDEVAAVMGESAIFLSGAEREGFGLPGAEAMAAGCRLIGFTGHGQKEYMLPGLADVVAESDVLTMAGFIVDAALEFTEARAVFDERSAAARRLIVEHYGPDQARRALLAAFGSILASEAALPAPVTMRHMQAYASKSGLVPSLYRTARRTARRVLNRLPRQSVPHAE